MRFLYFDPDEGGASYLETVLGIDQFPVVATLVCAAAAYAVFFCGAGVASRRRRHSAIAERRAKGKSASARAAATAARRPEQRRNPNRLATLSDYVSLICAGAGLALALGAAIRRWGAFAAGGYAYAAPLGLCLGITCAALGQAAVLSYHYARHAWGWFWASAAAKRGDAVVIQRHPAVVNFGKELRHHATCIELTVLVSYLAVTWMCHLMPASYYVLVPAGGTGGEFVPSWAWFTGDLRGLAAGLAQVDWGHVLQQLVCVDFFMYVVHVTEHRLAFIYKRTHKPHHRWTNPNMFSAFNASVGDAIMMILIPLYVTANLVHCNAWSYMAFGAVYGAYLMLIHSEYSHPWDPLFRRVGILTPADHHVHHVTFVWNFAHFFTWWDRIFGTYRAPSSVNQLRASGEDGARALARVNRVGKKKYVQGDHPLSPVKEEWGAPNTVRLGKGGCDAGKKQGGYGKVPIHPSGSLRGILTDPRELVAVVRYKLGFGLTGVTKGPLPLPLASKDEGVEQNCSGDDILFCGGMLDKVSRSFAAVIRQLPSELALPVCIFYLVLRALDTVEDDMDLSKFAQPGIILGDDARNTEATAGRGKQKNVSRAPTREAALATKVAALRAFYTVLGDDGSSTVPVRVSLGALGAADVGERDEAALLKAFGRVVSVFRALPAVHRRVVSDICRRMGEGMADYVARDLAQGTKDLVDYNVYCHTVAGLVGEGLSRQFAESGLEPKESRHALAADFGGGLGTLSSDMGLFLQKTNIIRDYLEDFVDGRAFWPREVWARFVPEGHPDGLGALARDEYRARAVGCLNALVCDALALVPSSLRYLEQVKDPHSFRFCAIPQVMAMATLSALHGNPKVFTGVVKIRKGLAARCIQESADLAGVHAWFHTHAGVIRRGAVATLAALDDGTAEAADDIELSKEERATAEKTISHCDRIYHAMKTIV